MAARGGDLAGGDSIRRRGVRYGKGERPGASGATFRIGGAVPVKSVVPKTVRCHGEGQISSCKSPPEEKRGQFLAAFSMKKTPVASDQPGGTGREGQNGVPGLTGLALGVGGATR